MPYSPYRVRQQRSSNNNLLVLLLIGLCVFFYAQSQGWINWEKRQDEQVIVDPDDEKEEDRPVDPVNLEDTYIVRVYETAATKDKWLAKQVNNEMFWLKWVSEQGMKLYTFDPDSEQSKTFVDAAKEQGINSPFWLHVKNGGRVLSINPFKESVGEETWKSIIKKSGDK